MSWCHVTPGLPALISFGGFADGKSAGDHASQPSTVVFSTKIENVDWAGVWSSSTFGEKLIPPATKGGDELSCFAIRLSGVSAMDPNGAAILIGVSKFDSNRAYRDSTLSSVPPWGAGRQDFGIVSSRRAAVDSDTGTFRNSLSLGMCAVHDGENLSPILSTHPAASIEAERQNSSGFWCDAATVGIVCNLTTNTLTAYLNDEIVRTTSLWYEAASHPTVERAGEPFEWKIDRTAVDLRDCRIFLSSFHTAFSAEFIGWSPPLASQR